MVGGSVKGVSISGEIEKLYDDDQKITAHDGVVFNIGVGLGAPFAYQLNISHTTVSEDRIKLKKLLIW